MKGALDRGEDLTSRLVRMGYRLTPQRMMVVSAIEHSEEHISAEEIYAQVVARYPHVNISTVYRTLELLKKLGLVTEMDMGDRARYHPIEKGRHHHLVCQECGKITDLDESTLSSLKNTLLKDYNFTADLTHLAVFGRCALCQRNKPPSGVSSEQKFSKVAAVD